MKIFSLIRIFAGCLIADFKDSRFRSVFFIGFANLLPDWYCMTILRPFFWRLAGVKINIFSRNVIRKDVWIDYPGNLTVGDNFAINRGSIISAQSKVVIGKDVRVGFNVEIHTISHTRKNNEYIDVKKQIIIENNCQIYSKSILLPGCIIKEGSDVLANSVVSEQFEEGFLVIGGNPSRIIKKVVQ